MKKEFKLFYKVMSAETLLWVLLFTGVIYLT